MGLYYSKTECTQMRVPKCTYNIVNIANQAVECYMRHAPNNDVGIVSQGF